MKKIVFLVDQLHEHGGIEKLVSIKANYWSRIFKYDITILSTENKNKNIIYDIDKSVKIKDLEINYNRSISYFSIENIKLLLKNILKIQKYIKNEKPDFIVVASHIPITYILPFLKLGKTKIIKEFHFTQYYRQNKGLKQKIFDFIQSKYHTQIVLSPEERKYYKTKNVEVIANPIENTEFNINQEKTNIASAVCRFAPVKQLESMIKAWSIFTEKDNENWVLKIYGDYNNEYGLEIKKLIDETKMENKILLMGQKNNILKEISNSKVFLMTSHQECFPMVILEAQSVGLPVISFNSPTGPRNIISNYEDGILVEHNNIEKFAEELLNFTRDKKLQNKLEKNSIKNAKKYTIENIMNIWKEKVFV